MNKVVSLPVAAAIPIGASALLAPKPAPADKSKLLALVEEYIAAQRLYGDLSTSADEMRTDYGSPPEALRIRPRDLELGRKPFDAADEFWHRPCDIDHGGTSTRSKLSSETMATGSYWCRGR